MSPPITLQNLEQFFLWNINLADLCGWCRVKPVGGGTPKTRMSWLPSVFWECTACMGFTPIMKYEVNIIMNLNICGACGIGGGVIQHQ
jgi:hypothetical protein